MVKIRIITLKGKRKEFKYSEYKQAIATKKYLVQYLIKNGWKKINKSKINPTFLKDGVKRDVVLYKHSEYSRDYSPGGYSVYILEKIYEDDDNER